jgi:hypothetical protein
VGVTIVVLDAAASLPSVQHTAWMLVNLLARFQGVVHRLSVRCPAGVKLCGRIVPLVARDLDLATALIAGGNAVGVTPVEKDVQLERTILIGDTQVATALHPPRPLHQHPRPRAEPREIACENPTAAASPVDDSSQSVALPLMKMRHARLG